MADSQAPGRQRSPAKGPTEPDLNRPPPRSNLWPWLVTLVLVLVGYAVFAICTSSSSSAETIAYSDFVAQVKVGNVATANFNGTALTGDFATAVSGSKTYQTQEPTQGDPNLIPLLLDNKVKITATSAASSTDWLSAAMNLVWIALMIGIGVWIYRQFRRGGAGMPSVGQSRARLYSEERPSVTFANVASNVEAKEELREIIEFLKSPERFTALGARIPHGVLLVGPPGTGKTLMARAVAGEANVPFFSVSATEFIEMFVGVGAARIRDLFDRAKKVAPCIVFVDEIDSIGRERGSKTAIASNEEREQTLNQLLVEMDGFEPNLGVIVLAATNRPDILDIALLRPGRFDRRVELVLPDRPGRLAILQLHAANVRMAPECDLESIARRTPGFSGADLANLVNEAALLAARALRVAVEPEDLEGAFEKVLLGARQQFAMTEEERHQVAVHEAGHAIAAFFTPGADPPEKVSVVPHGRSLGATQFAPAEDRRNLPEGYVRARLVVGLAGRAAEKLLLGQVSSGAESDLVAVNAQARAMVMQWGMGPTIGPVVIREQSPLAVGGMVSQDLFNRADDDVMQILLEAEASADRVIADRQVELKTLVAALQEHETLDRAAITSILADASKPPRVVAAG
ncbi:MAG TPA: ATP-dependent zinc metalloprotease FtsH [Candidatus Udaeobacter sp.]|nr:ATP-dependent zinc metalloprotease FtsH [Candidatus Udaeobacter sp.]